MTVMISYARENLPAVMGLVADLERAHVAVWVDRELSGGQAWWDAILGQIRACELFLVCLSPDSLKSRACASELHYAVKLNRPLLPIMLHSVAVQLAPPVIADTQIIDYRMRSVDAAIALISAVKGRPAAPPLPTPLPTPPTAPISYMNAFGEAIGSPALGFREQLHLVAELRVYLDDPADHDAARELLQRLRRRSDIAEGVARGIDQLLHYPGQSSARRPPIPQTAVAAGPPPSTERFRPTRGPAPAPAPAPAPSRIATPMPNPLARTAPELPLLVRWLHPISAALVVLMVIATRLPAVGLGAVAGGFALSLVAIHRTTLRPDRVGLRIGAFIWAGLWPALLLILVLLELARYS